MAKTFINAVIDESPTIAMTTAEVITDASHKAVKFNANGKAVLSGSGDAAFGVILGNTMPGALPAGTDVSVLIRQTGLLVAGGTIKAGNPVTTGAGGGGLTAASGDFILGWALDNAETGDHFRI